MGLDGKEIGYRLCIECDEPGCHVSCTYFDDNETKAIAQARRSGWAISKDRSKCWCANHSHIHRNVGRRSYFGNSINTEERRRRTTRLS